MRGMMADGATEEESTAQFFIVDKDGLLGTIAAAKPTVLLGLSGVGGLFSERAVREMARHVEQPVVLPLSNPLDASECTAVQAFEWTGGRALFASGSPFEDVVLPDGGLGLPINAITRIAQLNDDANVRSGRLLPRIDNLRDVSLAVAEAVALSAMDDDLAALPIRKSELLQHLRKNMWVPDYVHYVAEEP
eukprot:IDg8644t1